MSLAKFNPKKGATEGRRMRLNVAGMTDCRIFITVLGDDAQAVTDYIDDANKKHFEENGIVDRTPDQVKEFMRGRFAIQVTKVETEFVDKKLKTRDQIEVTDGEWLPAGEKLAQRLWEEDMKFVSDAVFVYTRNRNNFLSDGAGK